MAMGPAALLYIDPDPATCSLVETVLTAAGFAVCHAPTVRAGQQVAEVIRPDLILADVDRVRAGELVPALRGCPGLGHVRLLALTADARPEHREKMLALGFDRVWLHPLDVDTLARELALVLPASALGTSAAGVEAARLAGDGRAGGVEAAPAPVLEPVDVPPLWRLGLTPLVAQLVKSTACAGGILALLDEAGETLAVMAAAGTRRSDPGGGAPAGRTLGARILARSAPWLHPALHAGEVVVAATDAVPPSPLVPPGSRALLVVPVVSRERVRGLVIVGRRRVSRGVAFGPRRVGRTLAHAEQMGRVLEMLEALARAASEQRRQLDAQRLEAVRAVLSEVAALAGRSRRTRARDEAGAPGGGALRPDPAVRLGLAVAERLGLPARKREVLRQALEVRDLGTAWVEHVLLACATLSPAARRRLLDGAAEHGAEILSALDWPPAVVELVRPRREPGTTGGSTRGGEVPIEARLVAAVREHAARAAGPARDGEPAGLEVADVLASLARSAGGPGLDP